jgi:NADPH-dependent 2,4-dienoyl-CoA reductase/sulfur reductase-like enzyme/rhodanese-related sulfurtransferase
MGAAASRRIERAGERAAGRGRQRHTRPVNAPGREGAMNMAEKKAKRIVVIGGSAAGPKAAARARRLDGEAEITIVQKDADLSMASCGYPYYVGGTFDDRRQLICTPTGVVRDPQFFMKTKGVRALTGTEAVAIDRKAHTVSCKNLASGEAKMPPIPGVDLAGVATLHSLADADALRKIRDEKRITRAVVVGGGLIGMETCEALRLAGIGITVVEMLPQILTFLDWQLAQLLEGHVRSKAADVITDASVTAFLGSDGKLEAVKLSNGAELPCELAVVAVGVRPNSALARAAGLRIGELGGVVVDEHLATSDPDVYAAGDCIEVKHRITGRPVHAPYGDLANLQGRVAGENAALGNRAVFPGTIQTGICKVFDYSAGSTGLSETRARELGMNDIETAVCAGLDKPPFMGGKFLVSKIVADRASGRILGYQCVGPGDVSRQIGQAAMAILGNLTVADVVNADLPYAPPFSLAIDNFIATAQILENKMKGRMKGISAMEVKERVGRGEKLCILDVRGPDEYEAMRLGIGEKLIPLGALRGRLAELPRESCREIICFCKISLRGYEAARFLEAQGYPDVKVMEGGILAWPYPREK